MTIAKLMIILIIVAVLSLISLVITMIIRKKKNIDEKKNKLIKICSRTLLILLVLSSIGIISSTILIKTATDKGMYDNTQPINEIIYHTINSPVDQSNKIPDEPTNMLVLVYRFDCKDCNALHSTIDEDISNTQHINVSSRTPEGKIFSTEYGVNQVPSIVAFNSQGNHLTLPLYTSDDDGNPIYLPENTQELIKFASS